MDNPTCVVCGKNVAYRWYLCAECEDKYGKRKDEWPEWLRFLVNDAAKERMRQKRGYYPPIDVRSIDDMSDEELYEEGLYDVEPWDDDRFP